MKKVFNFVFFFLMVIMNAVVLSGNSLKFVFIMIMLDIIYLIWLSGKSNSEIFEITGASWLQKKFKSNEIIMDMTNE